MKDFGRVFLLILGCVLFYIVLFLLGSLNPFLLTIIGIVLAVVIIIGGVLLVSRNKENRHKKY